MKTLVANRCLAKKRVLCLNNPDSNRNRKNRHYRQALFATFNHYLLQTK